MMMVAGDVLVSLSRGLRVIKTNKLRVAMETVAALVARLVHD
jgi:hypothetical protein